MQRSQIVLLLYLGRALVLGRPRRFRAPNRGSLAAEVCDWNSATQPNLSIFGCQHRPVRLTTWQKDTKSQNTCLGTSKFPWMYMADQITQVKWTCFHCVMEWSEWSIEQSCLQDLTRPRPRSLILWIILFFPNAIFVPLDIFSMWGAQMKSTEKKTFLILHIPSCSVHWLREFAGLPQLLTECYRQMGTMQYAVLPVRDLRVSYPQRECGA